MMEIKGMTRIEKAEKRIIEGYLSTEIIDRQGDIVPRDEWEKALQKFEANPVVVLFHDINRPIGKLLSWEIREKGPWVRIEIVDDQVWSLIERGVLRAFSWQGTASRSVDDGKSTLRDIDLWEISVVAVPANPEALFDIAKAVSNFTGFDQEIVTSLLSQLYNVVETVDQKDVPDDPKLERCIFDLIAQGHDKSSAIAICRASLDKDVTTDSEGGTDETMSDVVTQNAKDVEGGAPMQELDVNGLREAIIEAVKAAVQETVSVVVPEVVKAVTPTTGRVGIVDSADSPLEFLQKSIDDMTTNDKNELAALTIRWLRGDFE